MGSNDGWTGRDLARVAVFAAVIVVLGMVGPIPGPGAVPITAQTLGVMLTGAILGARRGAASVLIVFLLVAIGLPVLAGGRGGLGVFLGPTAGFLIGWLPAAVVIGLIAHSGLLTWWRTGIACLVGGVVVVYAVGIPVQALSAGQPLALAALQSMAFLPGDVIKAVVATLLAVLLFRAYPPAFPDRVRARRSVSAA